MLFKGAFMDVRTMLLGFLMYGNMTGYDLKKFFSLSFSYFSGLSYGSIYPALKQMEREGLISMRMEIQDGAPNRKIYTITEAGRTAFTGALKTPLAADRVKSPFLARLFFFTFLQPQERLESACQYLESVRQAQKELEAIDSQVKNEADRYQYLCYQFGVRMYQDLVRNLSDVVTALESDMANSNEERA